jgi:hypothetical protein
VNIAEAEIRASGSLASGVEILGKMVLEIEVNYRRFPREREIWSVKRYI